MEFLCADAHTIEARDYFPPGFLADGRKKIPIDERLNDGVALSVYNDAGWGALVSEGKYVSGHYSDDLLKPSVERINNHVKRVDWVAHVPSLSRPTLVQDFAARLAAALHVPFVSCVRKTSANRPQKEMQNSTTQFSNAWESFEVDPSAILPGTCLLVDDIVDSAWTLTAVGVRLRRAGCLAVVPFALATARPRGTQ
jgi:ATP-dependent DNA helicase RecQ